ncbi:uncharacterized protein At1g51745 isoform X3 [Malania oleifera]|uniref:uncharacterized protein At1g51745 isoform X3 n=1 Tax=Malania oleifera TaxID=397392 RepID=UPI0025AEB3F8|nr:uncharacterized protein At1g51745 isoform X3 [Malania oleifera]
MGGSGAEETIDCSVGTIVWVRRRNGSWWPGKILGPDELSASHLMSPRSGTPVKLLGREDASVDWYNLEKSKRVKAFRCGEFDDCIERAESSQGMPAKKREKYARREDAILHALELEKQMLEKKHGKLGIASDSRRRKLSDGVRKESVTSSESLGNENGEQGISESPQISKRLDPSLKEEVMGSAEHVQKSKEGNKLSFEDDNSEAIPRMRGLQDFGLRIAPSKREGQTGVICRAKRSKCVYLPAESSDCLDHKENPPLQIEMSPSEVREGNCHPHPGSLTEGSSSSSMGDDDSGSSEAECLESNTDEEMDAISDSAVLPEAESKPLERSEVQGEHGSMSNDELDETTVTGDMPNLHPQGPVSASEGMSKWQLKGKRNIRNLTKKSADMTDGRVYLEEKGSGLSQRASGERCGFYSRRDNCENGFDEMDMIENDFNTQAVEFESRGYSTSSAVGKRRKSSGRNVINWEDLAWEDRPALKGYWEERHGSFDPLFVGRRHLGGRMKSMLVDVDLKVQARYQKEHVPIVSLMSRLNGKAIIGHPIQIEALEDGSSETLLSTADIGSGAIDNDGNSVLSPVWRTARRTANFRIPRPRPSSTIDSDEAAEHFPLDKEKRLPFKKLNMGGFGQKASLTRKGALHIPRPPTAKKFSRKPPKRVSLSSSQKIRTLSSIAVEQRVRNKAKYDGGRGDIDGLIKPESGPTTVACIPVKLVFSRLFEGVGRPPSRAAGLGDSMNGNMERNPS